MRHVKNVLFLACCFLVGMGIAMAILKYRAYRNETPSNQTGVGSAPPLRGFYLDADSSSESLVHFPALHATAVTLSYPASRSVGRLAATVAEAHHRGLKVILLPPPVFSSVNPYPVPLSAVAAQAQAAKIDLLCLSWINADCDGSYWTQQAALVRRSFSGPIIIAATPDALVGIDCFAAFDDIAAIGPIQIPRRLPHAPDDVDLNTLRVAWAAKLDELESLAQKNDKRLMLLNISVPVTYRAKLPLPDQPPPTPTPDPILQSLSYEALLLETKGRHSTEGLFLPLAPNPDASTVILPKIKTLWSDIDAAPPPVTASTTAPASPTPPTGSEPADEEPATDP